MADGLDLLSRLVRHAPRYPGAINRQAVNSHPFDDRNIHPSIAACSRRLFDDGHFSQATFEAFKFIDKEVERVSGLEDSGKSLMMAAFKENDPKIRLTPLTTSSEQNEQEGYKFLFAGAIVGIRNPRGHDVGKLDRIEECLDHLCLASMLLRKLQNRLGT